MSDDDKVLEESTMEEDTPLPPNEAEFIEDVNGLFQRWKDDIAKTLTLLNNRKEAKSILLGKYLQNEFMPLYRRANHIIDSAKYEASRLNVRHELLDNVISTANYVKKRLQDARKQYKLAADEIFAEIDKSQHDEAYLQRVSEIVQDELNKTRKKKIESGNKFLDSYVSAITKNVAYPSEEVIRRWVNKDKRSPRTFLEADEILGKK